MTYQSRILLTNIQGYRPFEATTPTPNHTPAAPEYELRPYTARVYLEVDNWSVLITDRHGVIVASRGGPRTRHDVYGRKVEPEIAGWLLDRAVNEFQQLQQSALPTVGKGATNG